MENFEAKLQKLEKLTSQIKQPDIPLEEALKNFEDGIKLAKSMEKAGNCGGRAGIQLFVCDFYFYCAVLFVRANCVSVNYRRLDGR